MRTTIDLDSDLLKRAKEFAARHRRTLTSLVEDALAELLGRAQAKPLRTSVRLKTSSRPPGTCPGVDLDHAAALLDVMDRNDDPV